MITHLRARRGRRAAAAGVAATAAAAEAAAAGQSAAGGGGDGGDGGQRRRADHCSGFLLLCRLLLPSLCSNDRRSSQPVCVRGCVCMRGGRSARCSQAAAKQSKASRARQILISDGLMHLKGHLSVRPQLLLSAIARLSSARIAYPSTLDVAHTLDAWLAGWLSLTIPPTRPQPAKQAMFRPPVTIDRRRGRAPPNAGGGASRSQTGAKRPAAAPHSGGSTSTSSKGGGGGDCQAALGQAQLRLEAVRAQLGEQARGPVLKESLARRAALQVGRLGLLDGIACLARSVSWIDPMTLSATQTTRHHTTTGEARALPVLAPAAPGGARRAGHAARLAPQRAGAGGGGAGAGAGGKG